MATAAPADTGILEVPAQPTQAASPATQPKDATAVLANHILMWSFAAAVVLAIGGFVVVAVYLFIYLYHAFDAFGANAMSQLALMDSEKMKSILVARTGLWKFILQSCGIISGAAFGFLGFALFLLGAKGDMDASFADSQHKVQLSRMAPGSFVILIAATLIGVCSLNKVEVTFTTSKSDSSQGGGSQSQNQSQSSKPSSGSLTTAHEGVVTSLLVNSLVKPPAGSAPVHRPPGHMATPTF